MGRNFVDARAEGFVERASLCRRFYSHFSKLASSEQAVDYEALQTYLTVFLQRIAKKTSIPVEEEGAQYTT